MFYDDLAQFSAFLSAMADVITGFLMSTPISFFTGGFITLVVIRLMQAMAFPDRRF